MSHASPPVIDEPQVVVDLEKLSHINSGLGQFCLHLARELPGACAGSFQPIFFLPRSAERFVAGPRTARITAAAWKKESLRRWIRPVVRPFLRRARIAAWHVTNQTSKYLPLDDRIPVVLTIHDLNFLHAPATGRRRRTMAGKLAAVQRKVRRARVITTVSHYVADELAERLDLGGKPVHVVPSGMAPPPAASPGRPGFLPAGPFLLTVGNCLPHKNFHVLLGLVERLPGMKLVIAGSKETDYGRFLEQEVGRRGLHERICMPGEVSDGDRQWLYEHCESLLFPSLAEGFGFPVLEAMQNGKPVFISRRTSLPEIAGGHGFFFDSFEAEAMAAAFREGMIAFMSDASSAERLRAHARTFDWAVAARRYVDMYRMCQDVTP